MRQPPEIVAHWVDMMAPLGPVRVRGMFGGFGLYLDDVMFALVAGDTLYLRADPLTRGGFEAAGLAPFKPWPDKATVMPYYPPPAEALDDADLLCDWAGRARDAARRARAASGSGKRRARRRIDPPLERPR